MPAYLREAGPRGPDLLPQGRRLRRYASKAAGQPRRGETDLSASWKRDCAAPDRMTIRPLTALPPVPASRVQPAAMAHDPAEVPLARNDADLRRRLDARSPGMLAAAPPANDEATATHSIAPPKG